MMSFILFSAMNNEQQIVNGKDYTDVVNNKVCKPSFNFISSFQIQMQFLQQINVKNYPFSIQHRDFN